MADGQLNYGEYIPVVSVPWVWLKIGGFPITFGDALGSPRHLVSFQIKFAVEAIGMFEVVLFDPEWFAIEAVVQAAKGKCTLKWGYTEGDQSRTLNGQILEYVPEFIVDGVQVTLRGMTTGGYDLNKLKITRAWGENKDEESRRISNIVKKIADDSTPKLHYDDKTIDRTQKILRREDLEATESQERKYQQQGETNWQFISKLQKLAVRESDCAGGYLFYIDEEDPRGPTLHFHIPRYEKPVLYTFKWRDKNSPILTFAPEFNGNLLAAIAIGGTTQVPVFDYENGKRVVNLINKDEDPKEEEVCTGPGPTDPAKTKTQDPAGEEAFQSNTSQVTVDGGAGTSEELANIAKFWWYRHNWLAAFQGELTLVGSPKFRPWEKYEIIVENGIGQRHWSDGVFFAASATHTIQGGQYTTSMELWRSDQKTGDSTGRK